MKDNSVFVSLKSSVPLTVSFPFLTLIFPALKSDEFIGSEKVTFITVFTATPAELFGGLIPITEGGMISEVVKEL